MYLMKQEFRLFFFLFFLSKTVEDETKKMSDDELKRIILAKNHKSKMSLHSCMTKLYLNLEQSFYWYVMKVDVAR